MLFLNNDRVTWFCRHLMANVCGVDLRDVRCCVMVEGNDPPTLSGERSSWHYETRGGSHIYYPSAYSKYGWSNMVYVKASWYTITCGIQWLINKAGKKARPIAALFGEKTSKGQTRRRNKPSPAIPIGERLLAFKMKKKKDKQDATIAELRRLGYKVENLTHHKSDRDGTFHWYVWHQLLPYTSYSLVEPPMSVQEVEQELRKLFVEQSSREQVREIERLQRQLDERKMYEQSVTALTPLGRIIFDGEGGFSSSN